MTEKTCGECAHWFAPKKKDGTPYINGYCGKWPGPPFNKRKDVEARGCFKPKEANNVDSLTRVCDGAGMGDFDWGDDDMRLDNGGSRPGISKAGRG